MNDDDRAFQKTVTEGLVPRVQGAAVCATVVPDLGDNSDASIMEAIDAQWCVQLGVMIMLDKPILAVVAPGSQVPERLKRVADEIFEWDPRTSDPELLAKKMADFKDRFAPDEEASDDDGHEGVAGDGSGARSEGDG